MITCKELAEFLNAYVDDALPPAQRRAFNLHLALCRSCRNYLRSYRLTIHLSHDCLGAPDDAPPPEVPEALIAAILKARVPAPD